VQRGALRDHSEVEEILHAAVCLAKYHHGVVLLCDHGVDGVDAKLGGLEIIEQHRIRCNRRRRCHRVAKGDVDLQCAARGANLSDQLDAAAAVRGLLANCARSDRARVEEDPVAHFQDRNFAKGGDQACFVTSAETQQVCVACGAVWLVVPKRKEQGAFEQESVRVG
jgi:hypothetical protein